VLSVVLEIFSFIWYFDEVFHIRKFELKLFFLFCDLCPSISRLFSTAIAIRELRFCTMYHWYAIGIRNLGLGLDSPLEKYAVTHIIGVFKTQFGHALVFFENSQCMGDFYVYVNWNLRLWSNPKFDRNPKFSI
jgi:hypothetical protein